METVLKYVIEFLVALVVSKDVVQIVSGVVFFDQTRNQRVAKWLLINGAVELPTILMNCGLNLVMKEDHYLTNPALYFQVPIFVFLLAWFAYGHFLLCCARAPSTPARDQTNKDPAISRNTRICRALLISSIVIDWLNVGQMVLLWILY